METFGIARFCNIFCKWCTKPIYKFTAKYFSIHKFIVVSFHSRTFFDGNNELFQCWASFTKNIKLARSCTSHRHNNKYCTCWYDWKTMLGPFPLSESECVEAPLGTLLKIDTTWYLSSQIKANFDQFNFNVNSISLFTKYPTVPQKFCFHLRAVEIDPLSQNIPQLLLFEHFPFLHLISFNK